jgi:hypothetical protein
MTKQSEHKIAADIIRRVLDAAERGDVEFLIQVRQSTRRKTSEGKASAQRQDVMEYGSYGAKFTEKDILAEIDLFDDMDALAEHLRKKYITRSNIDAVAKAIHLPSTKNLDYESVIGRIVDATLGYKIRSKAVRGTPADRKIKDEKAE